MTLKEIMRIFNKTEIAIAMHKNDPRVYRFVAGDIDQLTHEEARQMSDLINESSKLACIELETIATQKRRDAENKLNPKN